MKKLAALALTALISAGAYATTIANYDVSVSGNIISLGPFPYTSPSTYNGSGTATFDDNGTITLKISDHTELGYFYNVPVIYDTTAITTFNGTWNNSNFTATSATTQLLSCTDNVLPICPLITSTSSLLDKVSGTVNSSGGSLTGIVPMAPNWLGHNAQYTLTPSTVPVPATGWLFGSALLALPRLRKFRRLRAN